MKTFRFLCLFVLLVSGSLVACGQKGDLYFPDKQSAVESPFLS